MSRRFNSAAAKRPAQTDPKYGSELVSHMINYFMRKGKKTTARRIVYAALAGLLLSYPLPASRLTPRGRTWPAYAASFALFLAAYAFAMTSNYSPFIYFRF